MRKREQENRKTRRAEAKRTLQVRAEELKTLTEQRADLVQQMKEMAEKAKKEERAFTDEEDNKFEDLSKKVEAIDSTIKKLERAKDLSLNAETKGDEGENSDAEQREERAFEAYIRGVAFQERAGEDVNLTKSDNGAVIPSTIANKIIKRVTDICPIYALATKYNVGGNLTIPYYDETEQRIQMNYAAEFEELTSSSGKFTSIELKGFLAGALSKISQSLVNNSQFDIVSFVINAMADTIAKFIENEMLNGTKNKIDGLSGAKQIVKTAKQNAISTDDLIDLQEEVPDLFQDGAVFIMNRETRKALRKLKDNEGRYILNPDATAKWGYTLFGKDIYTSAQMPKMEAGKTAVYYGDMSGLAIKVSETGSIQVLREKFATQHAIGVVAWLEMDGKIENEQKIAVLKMAGTPGTTEDTPGTTEDTTKTT